MGAKRPNPPPQADGVELYERRSIVRRAIGAAKSEREWYTIVRFGLNELLRDSTFLIELIFEQAEGFATDEDGSVDHLTRAAAAADILGKLGLRLSLAPPRPTSPPPPPKRTGE